MSFFKELKRRNVVRVGIAYALIAWVLLQAADFFLDVIDAPNWVVQALLGLAVIGLPGVLTFSWVYEMTPEGIKREQEVDRTSSITPQTGRKLDRVIIVFLALVVGWFAFDEFYLEKQAPEQVAEPPATAAASAPPPALPDKPSVAVLPFENMSSDAENEYFSDGLTETLLHMLAQLPDLQVAARTSSFAFKGKDTTIAEIAATLGVAHILEGSVQKAGERVRVTAQLIRADDGFHVWSQNYTRPIEDIFAIQDEIATDVARALDESLLGGNEELHGVVTTDLDAYETYLKALEQQALFTYASLPVAETLFKDALAEDPGFVDAKLGLVRNHMLMMFTGLMEHPDVQKQSAPLLAQVMAVDSDNIIARGLDIAIRAWFDSAIDSEERRALTRELRDLLPLVPTEYALRTVTANLLRYSQNDVDAALLVIEAGLLVDPLESKYHGMKGELLGVQGRFDEALVSLHRADELRPNDPNNLADISDIYQRMGDMPAMLEWMRKATEADPRDHELAAQIALSLFQLKLPEEGDRWAARVAAQAADTGVGRMVQVEQAYAHGETERAIEMSRRMIEDDVTVRHGAFSTAVFVYQDLLSQAAMDQQGYEYLASIRPDLADLTREPQNFKELLIQMVMVHFQYALDGGRESAAHWEKIRGYREQMAPGWSDDPDSLVVDAIYRGDIDAARQIMVDDWLNEPISDNPLLTDILQLPFYAEVVAEPAVQARIAQRERETELVRNEVREMLLQPEWSE